MARDDTRYPILVDTDTLIAVANSPLWTEITEHIGLTTTNVCKQELERHVENTRETAPEGSRPYRLHYGSRSALEALTDDGTPLTQVTSVPRPHGADAGEESLRQEVGQNPEAVDYARRPSTTSSPWTRPAGARFVALSTTTRKIFVS